MKLTKILCPFHLDKNPSLIIYIDEGFKCYGCGKIGCVKDSDLLKQIYVQELIKYFEFRGQLNFIVE